MKVLVVTARDLPAGYVGAYGNEWVATPSLDRLAAEGVVFDRHYADHPDPREAGRVWRTGRYRFPGHADHPDPNPPPDLIQTLTDYGVQTVFVRDDRRPAADEFAEGWQTVPPTENLEDEDSSALDRALGLTLQALDGLEGVDNWLLWLDLSMPLPPGDLPDDYRDFYFEEDEDEGPDDEADATEELTGQEPLAPWTDPLLPWIEADDDTTFLRLQRTFAGAVTYLDAGLGLLFDELKERGLLNDLAILVTADRGQPLGEHGAVVAPVPWLHEERVHLPLILRLPGAAEAGRRVAALTQPVDLFPTLLDLFGLPAPPTHGHSLLPLGRAETEAVRPYTCSALQAGEAIQWALRTLTWAFLLPVRSEEDATTPGPRLYVKPDDRWEINDLIQHHLEWSQHLEQTLRDFAAATHRPGPLRLPALKDLETVQQEIERAGVEGTTHDPVT